MPAVEVLIAAVVLIAAMVFEIQVVMSPVVNMMVAIVALAVTIHWTGLLDWTFFFFGQICVYFSC